MPLDIRPQVVTALGNVNKNPELYTPPKPTTPLETRINDLKETNPNKYREHISTLTSSANSGNEKARELLGKIGEDAARQRRGYEGLNTAMYAPAIIGAGALAAPSASWIYSQLPKWVKTGIDVGLTADGARNFFSDNGWQKTKRELTTGNYGKAALSGIGDALDFLGGASLARRGLGEGIGYLARHSNNLKLREFANKSNFVPAKYPHLIRSIGGDFNVTMSDQIASLGNTKKFHLNTNQQGILKEHGITNFTTDRIVIPHGGGSWTTDDVFVFPRSFTRKNIKNFKSILPMDTFIATTQDLIIPTKKVTRISGRPEEALQSKTLTSDRLKGLYNELVNKYNIATKNGSNPGLERKFKDTLLAGKYQEEKQKLLWEKFGRPLKKDYDLLQQKTGLNPQVYDRSGVRIINGDYDFSSFRPWDFGDDIPSTEDARRKVLDWFLHKGEWKYSITGPSDYTYHSAPIIESIYRNQPDVWYNEYGKTGKFIKKN